MKYEKIKEKFEMHREYKIRIMKDNGGCGML